MSESACCRRALKSSPQKVDHNFCRFEGCLPATKVQWFVDEWGPCSDGNRRDRSVHCQNASSQEFVNVSLCDASGYLEKRPAETEHCVQSGWTPCSITCSTPDAWTGVQKQFTCLNFTSGAEVSECGFFCTRSYLRAASQSNHLFNWLLIRVETFA